MIARLIFLLAMIVSVCRGSTTIAVDDPALLASLNPYSWETVGSTRIRAINQGAQFTIQFTGTSFALNLSSGASNLSLGSIVDGGATVATNINSGDTSVTLATGLSNSSHTITVALLVLNLASDNSVWLGTRALTITGIVLDTGKSISIGTRFLVGNVLFIGDSITAGVGATPLTGWPALLAKYLSRAPGIVGFAGQGYEVGPNNIPILSDTFPYIYSGVSRSFTPAPDVVFINEGTNGTTTSNDVRDFLVTVRAAVGAAAIIYQIVPFGQYNVTTVTAGVTAYKSAHPSDTLVTLIDLGATGTTIMNNPALAPDGVHPNAAGCLQLAAAIEPLIIAPPLPGNPTTSAVGAGF